MGHDPRWVARWLALSEELPDGLHLFTLAEGGFRTAAQLRAATDATLLAVPGYGPARLRALREWFAAHPDVGAPPPLPWWVAEE